MNKMRFLPFTSFVEAACTCLGRCDVDVTEARQRRPTRLALYANRYMDPEIALNQLRNRRTVVEQRQGAAAHVGERLPRVDA
jgi:hypothetical protein